MDWINKEKFVFVLCVLLVLYAAASLFTLRGAGIGKPDIPEPMKTAGQDNVPWETERTLVTGDFGNLWKNRRDFFRAPDEGWKPPVTGARIPPPRLVAPTELAPVPSFIGAPPLVRPKPKSSEKEETGE